MSVPQPPTNLSPADNTTFPQGTTQVTLSWSAVAGATSYAVRANDLTDPNARYSGNNCPASAPHYLCVDNLTTPSFTVPVKAGHSYQWWVHAVNSSGVSAPTFANFKVSAASNSAQFISQSVPTVLAPNATAQVSVTMKNTGTTAWTQDAGYKLGSKNPENNLIWGGNGRVLVTSTVQPGGSFTFNWTIRAPATPGQYNFQWRMLRENVEWFGDFTPNVVINVGSSVGINSAQFISQSVPTVLAPNATAQVSVTMKNTGTTAWTQDAGYKLGSKNPENNLIWGGNGRVLVTSTVQPGGSFTFNWTIRAPATPGQYNFQWRMLRENVEWFGDFTPNVVINVAGSTVVNRLTRERTTGRILYDNQTTIFGGGQYDLFNPDGSFPRVLTVSQNGAVYINTYGKDANGKAIEPCPPSSPQSLYLNFWNQQPPWPDLFTVMRNTNNNLLRLFLTGGTKVLSNQGDLEPLYIFPFKKVLRNGKWKFQVYSAVVQDLWDDNYFNRLKAFADEAQRNNVFLQLSLFNYYDMSSSLDAPQFKGWCRSPYNPDLSDNPQNDSNWGNTHLVYSPAVTLFSCADNADSQEAARQAFFVKPANGLREVQEAFVRRTVQALNGRSNIIFEIMNEPRQSSLEDRARFYSTVVGWILNHGQGWRPLISVNASPLSPGGDDFDIDWWQRNKASVPLYDEVDMISYHGLTAYSVSETFCGAMSPRSIVAVDDASIGRRISEHNRRHANTKAIMLSTDAVRTHTVVHPLLNTGGGKQDMALRDGQIQTTYDPESNDHPSVKSDLADWAYWIYKRAIANRGVIHLHNHSAFDQSFFRIREGRRNATGS